MKDIRLWGILVLALAVRAVMLFAVFADVERAETPDSRDYGKLAFYMSEQGEFLHKIIFLDIGGVLDKSPEVFRTPGYPALLAAADRAADTATSENNYFKRITRSIAVRTAPLDLKIILSFQVLLDLHLVLLTFLLGRSLAGRGAGLLAALLQAVSPLAAAASCRILTDGIFAFLLTAAVLLLIRHFRMGGWWSLLSAAAVMGASCYIRPVGMAFSAVMALVVLCSRRGPKFFPEGVTLTRPSGPPSPVKGEGLQGDAETITVRPRRLLRTAGFACIVLLCIAPWVARNVTVADYWGFSSFATDSMYWYSAAEIEARRMDWGVETVRKEFRRAEGWPGNSSSMSLPAGKRACDLSPGGLARYRFAKAREIILAHPWDFADIHMRGNVAFWLPGAPDALEVLGYTSGNKGTLDVLHREGLVAAAKHYFGDNTAAMALAGGMVVIFLIRCVGVVLCGLWRLRPRRMTSAGWLCLLLVVAAFGLPGPANHPRFRVPVEPILSAAAAIGYLSVIEFHRRVRRDRREERERS